jgi:GT2 family glycosyltransferase
LLGGTEVPSVSRHLGPSAPEAAPEVSIVIVNWNTKDLLRNCLNSIAEQTRQVHEILVVDNASTDGSADMVRQEFPDITLIANSANRGFAAANNQAIAVARGRYVLLLNPDTVILDQAIDKMIDWCDEHPDVGCAGCQVMMSDTEIQQTCFADPTPFALLVAETGLARVFSRSSVFGRARYSSWDRRREMEVDVVSGMFMLIPRPVLDQVGFLDESFFVYAEEADLCRRIRQAGFRCVFTPVARIVHLDGGGKSSDQISVKMHVQLQKSLLIYTTKHYGLVGLPLVKTTFIASRTLRYALFSCLSVVSRSPIMQRRARQERASVLYHAFGVEPSE